MYGQRLLVILVFLFISIVAERERKKTCIHNLVVNQTNLLTRYRKQLLVIGIVDFKNQSTRIQANRYHDILRKLQHEDIYDPVVQFIFVNDKNAEQDFPGHVYGKIKVYQDNSKDRIIKKLREKNHSRNNFVFGRCGYLIYSQDGHQTDLDNPENFHNLTRVLSTAVKNRRRCTGLCS